MSEPEVRACERITYIVIETQISRSSIYDARKRSGISAPPGFVVLTPEVAEHLVRVAASHNSEANPYKVAYRLAYKFESAHAQDLCARLLWTAEVWETAAEMQRADALRKARCAAGARRATRRASLAASQSVRGRGAAARLVPAESPAQARSSAPKESFTRRFVRFFNPVA